MYYIVLLLSLYHDYNKYGSRPRLSAPLAGSTTGPPLLPALMAASTSVGDSKDTVERHC